MSSQYATLDEENNGAPPAPQEHEENDDDVKSVSILSRASASTRRRVVDDESLHEPLTTAEDDPFYVFREDLYRKLDIVEENLTEFLRIVHQTDTAVNTHALKDSKKQLKRHIKNAESTLKDVQMTVSLVESQREKFSHISSTELYDRTTLVSTSQERLNRAKQDMNSSSVKSKLLQDERNKAIRRAAASHDNEERKEQTAFIADSAARTSLMMQQQDETLEDLDEAVIRVGNMATSIHEELGQQNKILNEMDDDLADAEEKLGVVMGKLGKLLKTKDKCQLGTILTLIVIVIVLLFLVIYT
jgi:syntaxin 6